MELKIGDYVEINTEESNLQGILIKAKQEGWPLKIYTDYTGDKTTLGVLREEDILIPQAAFFVKKEYLLKISEKEYIKKIDLSRDKNKDVIKQKFALLKTERIPFSKRKIEDLGTKQYISTDLNSLITLNGGYLKKTGFKIEDTIYETVNHVNGTNGEMKQPAVTCCSFIRTNNRDTILYIPKTWLNYFGYDLRDLKMWLNFLIEANIGYNGVLIGTKIFKEVFKSYKDILRFPSTGGNVYKPINELCYEIGIPSSGSNYNYINFILTRFIYSHKYWNIPLIAMKLKKNIKSATHWDCILLAHCYQYYDGYYSLAQQTSTSLCLPSKFNSFEEFIKRYNSGTRPLNSSFKAYSINVGNVRQLIKSENYIELEKLINEYRNVN